MLKRLSAIAGLLALSWLAVTVFSFTSPVVFLHYSAAATRPVSFFFNDDNSITKDVINPGATREFRITHDPYPEYFIEVSLPLASRDGVEIKPPFSRVDVYIDVDTKISRTDIKNDYWARFASE